MTLPQESIKSRKTMTGVMKATLLATMAFVLAFYMKDTIIKGVEEVTESKATAKGYLLITMVLLAITLVMSYFWETE